MEPITLEQIKKACNGTYMGSLEQQKEAIYGVKIDSRKIEAGDLFVPIKGERVDGHDFISAVMKSGATCSLSERELKDADFPYIIVESCAQALQDLAAYYRESLDITVIGITGSVGKTSTKEMIASVLSEQFSVLKTEGNFNNLIGLPLTIFQINKSHQVAVLEMGISLFGEMTLLSRMAKPNIFVLTNIGVAHIENLGSREGILKAKTEAFENLMPNGQVLLNGDDDILSTIKEVKGTPPIFYGLSKNFTAHAIDIESLGLRGTSCIMQIKDSTFPVTIPLPGTHHVSNALAAAYLGKSMGLTDAQIKHGIESIEAIAGRSNIIHCENYTILDDCYNANPVSMRSALDVLSNGTNRRVAILGDMFELGAKEAQLHEEIGKYAAAKKIDVIICIGELSENMAKGAREEATKAQTILYFKTKEEALKSLPEIINDGDTLLLKASNGMQFSKLLAFLTA